MFFYLIYNSSVGKHYELEKRYLTTLLYGSILYILTHAYLNSSSLVFISKMKNYFWLIFTLDCMSMAYIYTFVNNEQTGSNLVENIMNQIENIKKNGIRNGLTDLTSYSRLKDKDKDDNENNENNNDDNGINDVILNEKKEHNIEELNNSEDSSEDSSEYNLANIKSTPLSMLLNRNKKEKIERIEKIDGGLSDDGSDVGSDVEFDLDSFEQSLG